jgi:hypothetical protein
MAATAKSPDEAKVQAEKNQSKVNKDRLSLEQDFGGKTPKYFVSFDTYGNVRQLQEIVGNQPEQRFLVVDANGIDYDLANGDQIVKQVRTYFKNNKEGLRKTLFDLGYMTEREYTTRSEQAITSAILKVANEYTVDVVDSFRIDGKTKFPTFTSWLSGIPTSGGKKDLPRRDINLQDRDVIRALVEDVYMSTNMQLPDDPSVIESKVDRYMDMIKKGVLTTAKEVKGENVVTSDAGFSESRLRAELGAEIPKENPADYQKAQSLNFLSFLAQMEQK